ncbi:MAG: hypothetical protein AAF215_05580 [Cyanobacteria bacterium P01_A01_bin.123]
MIVNWTKLTAHFGLWLIAEIFLTLVGLDNLADYGEYALAQKFRSTVTLNSIEF